MTPTPARPVLTLNCGSSSVKAAVVDAGTGRRLRTTQAERLTPDPDGTAHAAAVREVIAALTAAERASLVGVGHRIVHGGTRFTAATEVDDGVVEALAALVPLAPLHQPAGVAGLRAARAALPELTHVAVLDTAFHAGMPEVAARYAVPQDWFDDHAVRRYGFHGISHAYVAAAAAEAVGRPPAALRMVTLHLGNGCSAAAVRGGVGVDTTMGFTPLEGLMMGTRSGDVDPAVLPYLAGRTGRDADALVDDLNRRSGLLGVSGISHDVREVLAAADAGSAPAALALDLFCYRAAKAVGAMAVAAGGLDVLAFTGGIGENAHPVRVGILARLGHLGLPSEAAAGPPPGSAEGEPWRVAGPRLPTVLVVPTDEERLIARETAALLPDPGDRSPA